MGYYAPNYVSLHEYMRETLLKEDLDFVRDARVAVRRSGASVSSFFLITCVAFLVAAVGWAYYAELEEVTRGDGRVIPSSKTQMIQNLEGGIIKSILVREGDRVSEGQILGQIDDTSAASNLGELRAKELGLSARVERLRFEASGTESGTLRFDEDFRKQAPRVFESEQALFAVRSQALQNQLKILDERFKQRQQELAEVRENLTRLRNNVRIANEELELKEPLAARGIVSRTDLLRLQRDISDLTGELAATAESLPRIEAAIREAQEAKHEKTLGFRQTAQAELTSTLAELSIVRQSLHAAKDKVNRTDMRSPVDGIVNKIHVNTVGGVVRIGEPIMEITPIEENLLIEARIDPKDVAFVRPGQDATVKLTAYDFTVFGSINGKVDVISSDSILDKSDNTSYYLVIIRTDQAYLRKGKETLPIIPGMVASVDIITGKKSVLEYLLKPIVKARYEALRER